MLYEPWPRARQQYFTKKGNCIYFYGCRVFSLSSNFTSLTLHTFEHTPDFPEAHTHTEMHFELKSSKVKKCRRCLKYVAVCPQVEKCIIVHCISWLRKVGLNWDNCSLCSVGHYTCIATTPYKQSQNQSEVVYVSITGGLGLHRSSLLVTVK